MEEAMEDECVEVLVQTRGDDNKPGSDFKEAVNTDDSRVPSFSSFETLVRTILALEEDPRDEHSYAYSDKKQASEGKEKDHCYSTNSKFTHRRVQSLSDENLYRSTQTEFPDDASMVLPHYQSKDSALDVTGFDSISEKCLSFDNINVKTVDVVTERCILPGFSDPDISKMTLKNDESMDRPSSVPNSPPSKEQRLTIEHSYFKNFSNRKMKDLDKKSSPLWDHSYDTSQKRKSLPGHTGLKRGRSSEKVDSFNGHQPLKTADLTKSPFLDHTYQSCELKNVGKRQNKGEKFHPSISKVLTGKEGASQVDKLSQNITLNKSVSDRNTSFWWQHLHDHAYEKSGTNPIFGEASKRSRSYSLSETNSGEHTGLKTDHSYTVPNDTMCMEDDTSTNDSLSDSGTESLNEDEEENIASTLENLDAFHDHSYVTKWQKVEL